MFSSSMANYTVLTCLSTIMYTVTACCMKVQLPITMMMMIMIIIVIIISDYY